MYDNNKAISKSSEMGTLRMRFFWGFTMMVALAVYIAGTQYTLSAELQTRLTPFTHYDKKDGKREVYYAAGDRFLTTGFAILDRWWSIILRDKRAALRGHSDNYLPQELKLLGHRPADTLMRKISKYVYGARNPKTGLIPYSYNGFRTTCRCFTGGLQPVYLLARAAELARWFPEDKDLRNNLIRFADATIKYYDPNSLVNDQSPVRTGLWGWVDVRTGRPIGQTSIVQDYGAVARAMAYVSDITRNPRYETWALEKVRFVRDKSLNLKLPILAEQFIATDPVMLDAAQLTSDSDVLYHVRYLFDLYQITGRDEYRAQALSITDLWFATMWNPAFGHWLRKMGTDGKPAVDQMYGDGKYNTMSILVEAYRVTRDRKYLNRFWDTWHGLIKHRADRLVSERYKAGSAVEKDGPDPQQTIFLKILLDAYDIELDEKLLAEARDYGARILKGGKDVMRLEGGQAGHQFLRLALALRKVFRLEIDMKERDSRLTISRDGQMSLDRKVPGEVAVIYLPQGTYDVSFSSKQGAKTHSFTLGKHSRLNLDDSGDVVMQPISLTAPMPYVAAKGPPRNRAYQPQ